MPDKILNADGSVVPVVSVQGADGGTPQSAPATLTPKGYQQITALSAAVALTPPVGSRIATITAEAQDVRWRDDGTNPTATVGMLLTKGTPFQYTGNLAAIKFIETTASATLNIAYYA
jgi:hypothetical protein